jgi:glutamate N-acetyltransferase/amino-acid N-acetyltransferase
MTTDTFAKAAVTNRHDRRDKGHARRHHQGIGHDRARHGDDARLHLHRCRDRAGLAPADAGCDANGKSFSCITVDSDTSTSDTVLAFATGKAGNAPLTERRTMPAPMRFRLR